jgi:phenylpropionate dioxygenase-like ring-hydroxylating dioxygenase large terminal subunit
MRTNDSEDLTRVGPGTVMGDLMREYWIPALRSDELEPDGAPQRLLLLGEKLIAFRDTSGRVGVMEHQCPHRCASLFLGRNEQDGIRCIYHGWKFDVDGNCVDMPSVAAAHDFKHRIKAKAYRVQERAGLVWVYMGQRDPVPALPMIEITQAAEEDLDITFVQRSCNWVQSMEGDIDTSHFGFLHAGHLQPEDVPPGHPLEHTASERAPDYKVRDAAWGTTYGAHRAIRDAAGNPRTYWRFANFLFPFWTQQPQGEFARNVHARAWVPLDDHHTMFIFMRKRPGPKNPREPLNNGLPLGGSSPTAEYLPVSTDWLGRWKLKANEGNDWQMDRAAQRSNRIYSGIDNIHLQDQAVTESMGPITDHAKEHLGPGDMMISRTRRRLLQAARTLRETGEAPPGVLQPEVFLGARSGYFTADPTEDWQHAYEREVGAAMDVPTPHQPAP